MLSQANWKRNLVVALVFIATSFMTYTTVSAKAQHSREYHLKAAFLRYVAKFVEWPAGSVPDSELNICILGDTPSLKGLNSINGKIVKDKPLLVRPIADITQAKGLCQIVFVSKTEATKTSDILRTLKGEPILTFGDMEDFARDGGAMNFFIQNNRLAIMINQESVKESQFNIHPRMLRLVTVVPDDIDQTSFLDDFKKKS